MNLTRTFGIGALTATFLTTLCACGGSSPVVPSQSASTPAASTSTAVTSTAEPENTAMLYLMTADSAQSQYEFGYSGALTADRLLQGLTDLTGYHFDADKTVLSDQKLTVYWADSATFQPETGTPATPNQDLNLTFSDFDSELQFMLDTAYATLTKNLNVTELYFVTASGDSLDFTAQAKWKLPADEAYSGTFSSYYLGGKDLTNASSSGSTSAASIDSSTVAFTS